MNVEGDTIYSRANSTIATREGGGIHSGRGREAIRHSRASESSEGVPALTLGGSSRSQSQSTRPRTCRGFPTLTENITPQGRVLIANCYYECPFRFLECRVRFRNDRELWKSHALTHFDGAVPPANSICPFCDQMFEEANGILTSSWEARMNHVAAHHEAGLQLVNSSLDPALLRYLKENGLIEENHYRALADGLMPAQVPIVAVGPPIYRILTEPRYSRSANSRSRQRRQ